MMDQWEKALSPAERQKLHVYELDLSYRSTKEIIEYARGLLKRENTMRAVERNGEPVRHLTFQTQQQLTEQIVQEVKRQQEAGMERCAILCQTIAEARILNALLQDKLEAQLVSTEKDSTEGSLLIMPVYFAKGLEFDGVVAIEASKPKEDGLLSYILCSRALHCLAHITAEDKGSDK